MATCEDGTFTYLGLPAKFLSEDKEEKERCDFCQVEYESCALVMTRAQSKMSREVDKDPTNDFPLNPMENSKKWSIKAWAKRVKGILHLGDNNNLLDHK